MRQKKILPDERSCSPDDPADRFMKVELAREMGRFEEAKQWLNFKFGEDYKAAVALEKRLIDKKDTSLRKITE